MVWTGAGALAAAASIAIAFRMRAANNRAAEMPPPMGSSEGEIYCSAAGTTGAVCFKNTGAQIDSTAAAALYLVRGHIMAAFRPLPPGTEFSITTPHGTATVVGTQFTVDVIPGSRTEVRVIRGKVRVENAVSGTKGFVESGKFAILGDHLEIGDLVDPMSEGDRLLLDDAKQKAGVTSDADDDAKAKEEGLSATDAPKARHPEKTTSGTPPAQPASAPDLLEEARRLRAGGQYESSAEAYRRLVQRYPESPEARAAIVSLGQLELSQLGHPDAALRWFDKYLASGGMLRQEAAYGKIQALQRLGKSAQERREITHFLQEFPKSAQASALRTRLDALGTDSH
jgi:TolA-binding protein